MGYYSDSGYEPNSEPKTLRKGRFAKIVLIAVIATVLCYTSCVLLISLCGLSVPDSLTYCFFGFFGTEVISLVTIKIKKLKEGDGYAADSEAEGRYDDGFGRDYDEDEAEYSYAEYGEAEIDSADD